MLLAILIIINFKVIYDIISLKISVFNPVAIFALTVVTQMFPQLVFLYNTNIYNKEFIPNLLAVMITSQLAFGVGYSRIFKIQNEIKDFHIKDFSFNKIILLIILFSGIGLIPMLFYKDISSVYGGINVILGHFRVIGIYAYIITFIYIEKLPNKNKWLMRFMLVISAIPILYFAFAVKGSREIAFTFVIITLIFISRIRHRLRKPISLLFFILFMAGALVGESIAEVRKYTKNKEFNFESVLKIDYINNFKIGMFEKEIINGMDLGNATSLMIYVSKHASYDLGTEIWNDFVFNFIPGRFVGESTKEMFYINTFDNLKTKAYENSLRNNVTTITGYGSTFRSFSYLGFIIFYFIGIMLSKFEKHSHYSNFYLFVYIACLTCIPNMITHTTQYMFARIELIFIFTFPIFMFFLKDKFIKRIKSDKRIPSFE